MTTATPETIRQRWIATTPLPDDEVIQHYLDDAETLIFDEIPDLRDRLAADDAGALTAKLALVEFQMVSQIFRNPDGIRQRSQSAGSYTDQTTYGVETLAGEMVLTPAHRAMLASGAKRAYGVDMTAAPHLESPLAGVRINGPLGTGPGGR
ncbi:hypothetical protein [Corynebacterium antarcticum]|uniref:hypothetical protein n=1 Tax=Corynebacterium antarcticum TaxID=2800405 RepID=UPI002005869C|nr:hypothetical protein [Corynebacterium antarcticum]MCK7661974.1 hypothetical protein [Corynebacterium antarcticum]